MIRLNNIVKRFGEKIVYDGFDAEFSGITAVLGRSGSGKTTLLNIIASLTEYEGKVEGAKKVSYMFQQPRLINNLTVLQNLLYVGVSEKDAGDMLKKVEIDGNLYPKQLSGGMADRASLARAFAACDGVLLMDEPFRGLDIGLKTRIMELFKELYAKKPCDVVFVTHSPYEAAYLADRAVIIENGSILADFRANDVNEKQISDVLKSL